MNDLVFGSKGEGSGDSGEIVVEMLVRGVAGRKRNVDRELEAWSLALGPCQWSDLEELRSIWSKQAPAEVCIHSKNKRTFINDVSIIGACCC